MVQPGRMQSLPSIGVIAALAYGMMGEILFQEVSNLLLGTRSLSFLFLVPMGIGAVTVALGPEYLKTSWPYAIFAPWAVCALLGLVVWLMAREAWICVFMGLPIFFVMSSLGGALMRWWFERREARGQVDRDERRVAKRAAGRWACGASICISSTHQTGVSRWRRVSVRLPH